MQLWYALRAQFINPVQFWAVLAFWTCAFLVGYTYVIYPLLLFVFYALSQARRDLEFLNNGRRNRRAARPGEVLPTVSVVVAAYNEEDWLPAKLANLRDLEYPPGKLEVILVSDGSTDRTNSILGSVCDQGFRVLLLPERKGKANALNCAIAVAQNRIVVLSDASTMISPHSLQMIVRHFSNPKVGAVCGALQFEGSPESRHTEGIYWRYESMLRLMEARLGATLTASGAFYAIRRDCFEPLPVNTIIDDFIVPMNVRRHGAQVLYDPEAVATELAAGTVSGEFARRVRIAIGSFRALPNLLRVPMPGFTRLAFLSHKLLRWILPFVLIGLAFSNMFLLGSTFYVVSAAAQITMLVWGLAGMIFRQRLAGVRMALLGYFLLAMHLAFLIGFVRSLGSRKEATWARIT
jgi:cellulose synthase/poly-beta-1,6-N-acetylglucosamine synthase-like glycosyltransferase